VKTEPGETEEEGVVIDYQNMKLMHYHGDDRVEMSETSSPHHDAASHDEERALGWYRRVFRCNTCDEEVVVEARPSGDEARRSGDEPRS
jgi:hypothetical protein